MSTKSGRLLAYLIISIMGLIFGVLFWWLPSWRPVLLMAILGFVAIGLIMYQTIRAYVLFKHDAIQTRNQQRPCPYCEAPIYKSDTTCPYCRRDVSVDAG